MGEKFNIAAIKKAKQRKEAEQKRTLKVASCLESNEDFNIPEVISEDELNSSSDFLDDVNECESEFYVLEKASEEWNEIGDNDSYENIDHDVSENEAFQIKMVDRDLIKRNEGNFYKVENIDELAMLISENGLEQNLVVYKDESGKEECYRLLSGERRYLATQKLFEESNGSRFQRLPCKVVEKPEDNADEVIKIIEGNQYRQLTDAEQYEAFLKLQEAVKEKIKNGESIKRKTEYYANLLNLSKRQIEKFYRINRELSKEQKQEIIDGNLSISNAEKTIAKDNKSENDINEHESEQAREKNESSIEKIEQLSFLDKTLDTFSTLIKNAKKYMNSANSVARQEDAVRAEELANKIQKDMEELNNILDNMRK